MEATLIEKTETIVHKEPEYKLLIKDISVNGKHFDSIEFTVIDKNNGKRVYIWGDEMSDVTPDEYDEAEEIIEALEKALSEAQVYEVHNHETSLFETKSLPEAIEFFDFKSKEIINKKVWPDLLYIQDMGGKCVGPCLTHGKICGRS